MAVKAGAPKPDITTVEQFKATLLKARTVAYSKIGASGIFFAGLLDRLGIAGAVRSLIVPSGFTAERLITGEADLAIQQISELMMVPGIDVVGPLPPDIQTVAPLFRRPADPVVAPRLRDSAAALLCVACHRPGPATHWPGTRQIVTQMINRAV